MQAVRQHHADAAGWLSALFPAACARLSSALPAHAELWLHHTLREPLWLPSLHPYTHAMQTLSRDETMLGQNFKAHYPKTAYGRGVVDDVLSSARSLISRLAVSQHVFHSPLHRSDCPILLQWS